MLYSCKEYVDLELENLANLKHRVSKLIKNSKKYEGYYLLETKRKHGEQKYTYYISAYRENGKEVRKYLGAADGKHSKTIAAIKERRFLMKCNSIFDWNINVLEECLYKYQECGPENIEALLGHAYSGNQETIARLYDTVGDKEWVSEMEALKTSYGLYYPEDLIHKASDGALLRSKSEVIIYMILKILNIPFVYELPRYMNGILYRPDFTFRNAKTKETVIVEYMGLVSEEDYRESNMRKVYNYFREGFILGKNFFVFMDDGDGHIDGEAVSKFLKVIYGD